jgi:hypothetical protein
VKFGVVLPFGDPRTASDVAQDAERAGWDGFFVFEPVWGFDAWVALAAAAVRTERIRLGTMLSPLSRMRPWKLASETVSLDHLSGGRLILSVGLGAVETGFGAFGEVTDRRTRAELLDEGLEVLTGLWAGQPFRYEGQHYRIEPRGSTTGSNRPASSRRPHRCSGRASRSGWSGRGSGLSPWLGRCGSTACCRTLFDADGKPRKATPEDVAAMRSFVADHHQDPGTFDIVVEGETPGDEPAALAAAGATWWLEVRWAGKASDEHLGRFRERVGQGPPAL